MWLNFYLLTILTSITIFISSFISLFREYSYKEREKMIKDTNKNNESIFKTTFNCFIGFLLLLTPILNLIMSFVITFGVKQSEDLFLNEGKLLFYNNQNYINNRQLYSLISLNTENGYVPNRIFIYENRFDLLKYYLQHPLTLSDFKDCLFKRNESWFIEYANNRSICVFIFNLDNKNDKNKILLEISKSLFHGLKHMYYDVNNIELDDNKEDYECDKFAEQMIETYGKKINNILSPF